MIPVKTGVIDGNSQILLDVANPADDSKLILRSPFVMSYWAQGVCVGSRPLLSATRSLSWSTQAA